MLRRASIVVVLLMLGAIVTIAVSWACAAFIDPTTATHQFKAVHHSDADHTAFTTLRRLGHTRIDLATFSILTLDPETNAIRSAGMSGKEQHSQSLTGWPMLAMSATNFGEVTIRAGGGSSVGVARTGMRPVSSGIELARFAPSPQGTGGWRALPLSPIWTGFIINSLLYALLLWLLLFGPFAWRRMQRRRRNLCLACGYPIGTSPTCTECGAAVAVPTPQPPPTATDADSP